MKQYEDLSPRGRSLRLRQLAIDCLQSRHGIEAAVSLLSSHSFNTVFRVVGSTTGRSVLRVGSAIRIHSDALEEVEAEWLDALVDAGFENPVNLRSRGDRVREIVARTDVLEPRVCARFSWVTGRPLSQRLGEDRIRAAGRLLAELHDHAAGFSLSSPVPEDIVADRAIHLPRRRVLPAPGRPNLPLISHAVERVQAAIDRLWNEQPHPPHLLHGDFGPHNVLTHHNRLSPIDFQDLRYGFAAQDVAITVADLRRTAPELVAEFRVGYDAVRPWPDLPPTLWAALEAARSLDVMNLAVRSPRTRLATRYQEHADRITRWMSTSGTP